MNDNITLLLAAGIACSVLWERRTGLSSGGLITPGVLALSLYYPQRILTGFFIAFLVWGLLEIAVRYFNLYGRTRTGVAMLLALSVLSVTGHYSADPFWFGWVVPGLIAADIQRQGIIATVCSAFICSFATAFFIQLIISYVSW
ncbi:MAG: poly-gamma-glutamate biosynthesis protein PgsC/CapC [Synergistaceae bacterium]|nr:poly-gamma-glutamate biosynthesis protein PgsC/CapC [Synergistaceae bacterium]